MEGNRQTIDAELKARELLHAEKISRINVTENVFIFNTLIPIFRKKRIKRSLNLKHKLRKTTRNFWIC